MEVCHMRVRCRFVPAPPLVLALPRGRPPGRAWAGACHCACCCTPAKSCALPIGGGGPASPGRRPSSRRLIAWSNLFSNRLFTPAQPAGAGTCTGTECDLLGSPTCTCRYARLLARAACQLHWGSRTAVLERLLDLLQLGLLLVEQLKPIRLAPRRILERGCRLRD